jgi:hypothetical protein
MEIDDFKGDQIGHFCDPGVLDQSVHSPGVRRPISAGSNCNSTRRNAALQRRTLFGRFGRTDEGREKPVSQPTDCTRLEADRFRRLGGSGIHILENAWKRARRRPPRFENNREANNFTLTLDWRLLPALHDEFWHSRLGVKLTVPQARALDLIRSARERFPRSVVP